MNNIDIHKGHSRTASKVLDDALRMLNGENDSMKALVSRALSFDFSLGEEMTQDEIVALTNFNAALRARGFSLRSTAPPLSENSSQQAG